MKILHTADWHIGKKLHKHDLYRDFDLFIDWLCHLIEEREIEVLLVSGDVFDLANPSSEARNQYYRSLMRLKKLKCRIILTGGNHDSPAMLDAPKEIFRALDMHVIGGLPENIEDVLIPLPDKNGKPEAVVAALPYLRDADLRTAADGHAYEDRIWAIRNGIAEKFTEAAKACEERFPGVPAIALGHLFAAGMETSESERDIQIGNLAAFDASLFGNYYSYIGLGHIHKPQQVKAKVPTFYSGSPLPLSFSERRDEKRVLLLDTAESWTPESISVPSFRKLLKISGNVDELKAKLEDLEQPKQLASLIEVEMTEEQYDAEKIYRLDELVTGFSKAGFEIVKHRASFKQKLRTASEIYEESRQLEDLKPREVFAELISGHEYDEETRLGILSAFDEILQEVQQDENLQNPEL